MKGQAISPSVEAVKAIRRRDASLLSMPLSVAGMTCSSFWAVYGLAVAETAIWFPNAALFLLSAFNLAVKCVVGLPKNNQLHPVFLHPAFAGPRH